LDYLWSPWRFQYLAGLKRPEGCIFCAMAADPAHDEESLLVHRGAHNFIVLNRFPYTSGHLMVVPYVHSASLAAIEPAAAAEMMDLMRIAETKLRGLYRPDGMNLGMNMGEAAGAGIAGHIHLHLVPRWAGDANFMTITSDTRVLPEDLAVTWKRVHDAFLSFEPAG
jgi:ATP adenylyltransferase